MGIAALTQRLGRIPGLGRTLRLLADRFEEGSVVRIRQGRAAGMLWRRHHRYVNGYWIGQYELAVQEALTQRLGLGNRFFDVGANAGFFTLIAARAVGPTGQCVAFDPSPHNEQSVREQIELNGLASCSMVRAAVGEEQGRAAFCFETPGSATGHLGAAGQHEQALEVDVTTLDLAMDRFGPPDFVKMDIEGAEVMAMRGARRVIEEGRPDWLIEQHGPDCERAVKTRLRDAGYVFESVTGEPLDPAAFLPEHFIAVPGERAGGSA